MAGFRSPLPPRNPMGDKDRSPTPEGYPDLPRIAPPIGISEETMDAWGVDPVGRVARDVQDAREDLMDAMTLADRKGLTDIHRRLGHLVLAVDDELAVLAERSSE